MPVIDGAGMDHPFDNSAFFTWAMWRQPSFPTEQTLFPRKAMSKMCSFWCTRGRVDEDLMLSGSSEELRVANWKNQRFPRLSPTTNLSASYAQLNGTPFPFPSSSQIHVGIRTSLDRSMHHT